MYSIKLRAWPIFHQLNCLLTAESLHAVLILASIAYYIELNTSVGQGRIQVGAKGPVPLQNFFKIVLLFAINIMKLCSMMFNLSESPITSYV